MLRVVRPRRRRRHRRYYRIIYCPVCYTDDFFIFESLGTSEMCIQIQYIISTITIGNIFIQQNWSETSQTVRPLHRWRIDRTSHIIIILYYSTVLLLHTCLGTWFLFSYLLYIKIWYLRNYYLYHNILCMDGP